MTWQSRFLALSLLCGAAWASPSSFVTTWGDPSAQPINPSSGKMAVVFMARDPASRRDAEDLIARRLREHGIQAVPAESIMPTERGGDASAMLQRFADVGIDTVLIMRVLGEGAALSVSPPPYYRSPQPWEYRLLSQYWGYGWGQIWTSGYLLTDTAVSMETLVYSHDLLLWGSRSYPSHRYQIPELTAQLADVVPVQMERDGMLSR